MHLRVPNEFVQKFPNLSVEKQQLYYNRYLKAIRKAFIKRLPFMSDNYTHLSLTKIGDICGKFEYETKRYYIWKEFKDLRPFFVEIPDKKGNGRKRGNNFEKNSEVYIMNQKLIDVLIDNGDAHELVNEFYGEVTDETVLEPLEIDMQSLKNYIQSTENELQSVDHNSKLQSTLYRNLRQAKYIKIIGEFFYPAYDKYILPQIPKPSPYGRIYYKGINIQNVSKVVRSAVLGTHYSYDLNAAVYAIRLMMVKQILKENQIDDFGFFTYTKEYLEFKKPIREKLAAPIIKHIPGYSKPIELVKEAITSIGFGARIGGGTWQVDGEWVVPTLESIIMNKTAREEFMRDPWVKSFVKEQQDMTKIIAEYYINTPGFEQQVMNVPNMFKNDKIRKSQVMSYVFQHMETSVMSIITKNISDVVRIHDAFITRKPLRNDELVEIKYVLNNLDPLFTIDCEQVNGWLSPKSIEIEDNPILQRLSEIERSYTPKYNFNNEFMSEGFYDTKTYYAQLEYEDEE